VQEAGPQQQVQEAGPHQEGAADHFTCMDKKKIVFKK
jgi:hypothetical protein